MNNNPDLTRNSQFQRVENAMGDKAQLPLPDLFLLLSLLLIILMYPVLDHGQVRRFVLGFLTFLPVLLATIRLSKSKRWLWPSILLMLAISIVGIASDFYPNAAIVGAKWCLLAAFFGMTVAVLFPYLKNALYVTNAHLYTAVSIYLLLGMLWFAVYCAIDVFLPGAILLRAVGTGRQSELLYFSLITLSTIGYGDIVPLNGEVRMLVALEGITGVLYIAISVAVLVSAYKQKERHQ
jgi:Ion channel